MGLKSPESCTCLRRIPGTNDLLFFWNTAFTILHTITLGKRSPLSAAQSQDAGNSWTKLGDIETGHGEYRT